jgi:hypothetical protein
MKVEHIAQLLLETIIFLIAEVLLFLFMRYVFIDLLKAGHLIFCCVALASGAFATILFVLFLFTFCNYMWGRYKGMTEGK